MFIPENGLETMLSSPKTLSRESRCEFEVTNPMAEVDHAARGVSGGSGGCRKPSETGT